MKRAAAAQFARYSAIGSFVFCIDVGFFQLFVWLHVLLPITVTASYLLGLAVNFSLNKYWNFRSSERTFRQQLRTYLAVNGFILLDTIGVVEGGVHAAHFSPLDAKLIAVALNVPLGFLAHKYLTFGRGIGASLQELRARRGFSR